jgi:hypothetical protein
VSNSVGIDINIYYILVPQIVISTYVVGFVYGFLRSILAYPYTSFSRER